MGVQFVAVSFETDEPIGVATFWAELLGRHVVSEPGGALVPGAGTQIGLRFVAGAAPRSRPHRLHLHLTSDSLDHQQQTVATALRLGARHIDVGQSADEGHVVLADPAGYELCVIEPGNNYLAGTGLLGEVACDGTRDVGLFWRDVLGWPLVWDQGEETAVQSPHGGTKVSWGGAHETDRGRSHLRFDLAAFDVAGEVERVVALGATVVDDRGSVVMFTDPDGDEFSISRAAP
jgi:hypothetical protein